MRLRGRSITTFANLEVHQELRRRDYPQKVGGSKPAQQRHDPRRFLKARVLALLPFAASLLFSTVAAAQGAASVSADAIVKVGEPVNFTITLDRAPSFSGGAVEVTIEGPDGRGAGMGLGVQPGQKEVHGSFNIPPSAKGGMWRVVVTGFFDGFEVAQWTPTGKAFRVIPASDLVVPSSAAVTVNPTQIQFLRQAATRVQDQLQALKATVSGMRGSGDGKRVAEILRQNVRDAIKAVDATEAKFHELAVPGAPAEVATAFFDDIRTSYQDVLARLAGGALSSSVSSGSFVDVSLHQSGSKEADARYPASAEVAFRAFEQNELAYSLVADTQSLTFDLAVSSEPEGATISYRRRGDPYRQNPDPTNTTVKALPYAIWIIQFQKEGFRTEEREHDPFREPNHTVNVDLKR